MASRTLPARVMEWAKLSWLVQEDKRVPAVGTPFGLSAEMGRPWVTRFNAEAVPGLEDRPCSGRPVTDANEQVGEVLATALTKPETPWPCRSATGRGIG